MYQNTLKKKKKVILTFCEQVEKCTLQKDTIHSI